MGRVVTITLPGHPPGGNELHRMTWRQVQKSRETWKRTVEWLVMAVLPKGWEPITYGYLAVEWRYRVKRNRDLDNLVAGLKPLIDGLVSTGVLADDHSGVLAQIGPLTVQTGCSADETILTITEGIP